MSDRKRERPRQTIVFEGVKSLVKPSFQDECDINQIMAKFEKTAMIDHLNQNLGSYGDFTEAPTDLMDAMNKVNRAKEFFAGLRSDIRAQFDNDTMNFLQFLGRADHDELVEAGLLPPLQTDAPTGAPGGPEAAPDGPSGAEDGS